MPRKQRLTEPGLYHIINRGVEQRNIYLESLDYDSFLNLLLEIVKKYDIVVHSFCLMTNHYHILLETKENNLSKAIQHLNDKYAKFFNKKYKRSGHLWQGRFKSYPLFDDAHFWVVVKYIERNPIKANMIKSIDMYEYQSFFQWKNKHNYFELLNSSKIFNMTLKEYIEYIETELTQDAIEIVYKTPKLILIDNKFKVLDKRLETFFDIDTDIDRNSNVRKAYNYGYTKSEIARYLLISHTAVSKILVK